MHLLAASSPEQTLQLVSPHAVVHAVLSAASQYPSSHVVHFKAESSVLTLQLVIKPVHAELSAASQNLSSHVVHLSAASS